MQKREKTGIIVFLIPINGFSPAEEIFVLATAAVFVPLVISLGKEGSSMLQGWADRKRRVYGEGVGPQPDPAHLFAYIRQNTDIRGPAGGVNSSESTPLGCKNINNLFRRVKI